MGQPWRERRMELCLAPHLLLGRASISPCSSLLSQGKVHCQRGTGQTCSPESVQQPLLLCRCIRKGGEHFKSTLSLLQASCFRGSAEMNHSDREVGIKASREEDVATFYYKI